MDPYPALYTNPVKKIMKKSWSPFGQIRDRRSRIVFVRIVGKLLQEETFSTKLLRYRVFIILITLRCGLAAGRRQGFISVRSEILTPSA